MALVDAAPVRAHVAALRARGVGLKYLSKLAGLSETQVAAVANAESPRCRSVTADALLAVPADTEPLPTNQRLPIGPYRARLQGALAAGWTVADVARAGGVAPSTFNRLLTGHGELCVFTAERLERGLAALAERESPGDRLALLAEDVAWLLPTGMALWEIAAKLGVSVSQAEQALAWDPAPATRAGGALALTT